jgi:ABC-2 type transport system ATP-binding protein
MLEAADIVKKFKNTVLNGVCFNARPGEIVGVAGENGSGKSTLLSILTGLSRPDRGRITLDGLELTQNAAMRKEIGFVPQENALFDTLSVRDNLRFWAAAHGRADAWRDALPYVRTEDETEKTLLRKKAGHLSGGMKKRLMDEPSAALDIGFKRKLAEMLSKRRNAGQCVVFTSHQPDELLLCDRIYVLRGGVFVYEGAPEALGADLAQALFTVSQGTNP